MNDSRTDNTSMFFIAGMMFGITLTALLTPRSGEEIRENIRHKINDAKEITSDTADKVSNTVEDKSKEVKEALNITKDKMDSST